MPFVPFTEYFEDLAEREIGTVILTKDANGLPAGEYGFFEMFCDEVGCDCRRVMLHVHATPRSAYEAVINFGWEDPRFYADWLGDDDPEMVRDLVGPVLNFGSPQSELAPAILEMASELLLQDPRYVGRIQRHYSLMRAEVARRAEEAKRSPPRVGRNAPCPCGSGRKFKKCCAGSSGEESAAAGRV